MTRLTDAMCKQTFACCSQSEITNIFRNVQVNNQPITTEAQCEEASSGLVPIIVEGIDQEVAKGAVVFDDSAVDACIAALDSCSIATPADGAFNTICPGMFVPQLAAGAACDGDGDCTTGFCNIAVGSNSGVCAAVPTQGEHCTDVCTAGLSCQIGQDPMTGETTNLCLAKVGAGSACVSDDDCTTGECTAGSDGLDGTCTTPSPGCIQD